MTLDELEGYEVRLIGPKNTEKQAERMRGYQGKADTYYGVVKQGAIVVEAPAGTYDLSWRKEIGDDTKPWYSSPLLPEYVCR